MLPLGRRCLLSALLLCAGLAAHGQIALTNFSSANPIKIMPVGDQLTADTILNGAWRLPLQPLLESNGFPFTFVGRQTSAAATGFTKRKHEGYYYADVAPPGIQGMNPYPGTNSYLQKIVPDALTNAIPDVMLIMIGTVDIGEHRNLYTLATNDIPNLLNLIFAKAPNTTVILDKIARLDSGYGPISGTNVPTYNAQLQAVVNQRRALGQKVYLADIYSTLNFSTVNPNAAAFQAFAQEWLTRIQTITIQTNLIVTNLIYAGANWNYNDTGQDLGTNWTQPGYDDSAWSNGPARLGYGDLATATPVSFGPQSTNKYPTTYFRRSFVVPWNAVITNLNLRVSQADGAVVWLNGQEIYRTNLPSGLIAYTNLASSTMGFYPRYILFPTNIPITNLPVGSNWLAVEVHLASPSNPTLGFDMELIGSGYQLRPPSLSIASADATHVTLNWPADYAGRFSLYSATNLSAPATWTPAPEPLQTNAGQITVTPSLDPTTRFFRLQQP